MPKIYREKGRRGNRKMEKIKAVMLDGGTIVQSDLNWDRLSEICALEAYEDTKPDEVTDRIKGADAILVSKVKITGDVMDSCPGLKYIGVMATGYDNVDVRAAKDRGIAVTNIPAYSGDAVAQHTFALIMELTNHVGRNSESVKNGDWYTSDFFCYSTAPITLLAGKTIGIIGYGNIGRKVAAIAEAFGMKVNIYSRGREAAVTSDIVTLHCPLTPENKGFVNSDFISHMKKGAILINTARGGLVNSADLAEALNSGRLAGAGIDVLEKEPPEEPHPLIEAKNCIVTPHNAWMPVETREKLIGLIAGNLSDFIAGKETNRVEK
jgi:glycerate dehydrogenase